MSKPLFQIDGRAIESHAEIAAQAGLPLIVGIGESLEVGSICQLGEYMVRIVRVVSRKEAKAVSASLGCFGPTPPQFLFYEIASD